MSGKVLFAAIGLVVLGVLTRLIPHPINVTALTAIALWSSTLFPSRKWGLGILFMTLVVSDFAIGFHPTVFWVYGSFALIALLSYWVQPRESWARALGLSVSGSLLFFAITNFGVWTTGLLYPMTSEGLLQSYVMGLPFLKNQILGDLIYTGLIGFAAKALADRREGAVERA